MKKLIHSLLSIGALGLFISNATAGETFKPDSAGYIRDWLMLAPVPLREGRAAGDLILEDQIKNEGRLQPRSGDKVSLKGKELTWKHITASTNYFDFNAVLKTMNDHTAGYMVTYIECEREMPGITMAVGSNDEGRLYLNGEDIYAFTDPRILELDADKGKVDLKKGTNVIVFKIINELNSWQGAMRFLDKSGAPITDLKVKLSP